MCQLDIVCYIFLDLVNWVACCAPPPLKISSSISLILLWGLFNAHVPAQWYLPWVVEGHYSSTLVFDMVIFSFDGPTHHMCRALWWYTLGSPLLFFCFCLNLTCVSGAVPTLWLLCCSLLHLLVAFNGWMLNPLAWHLMFSSTALMAEENAFFIINVTQFYYQFSLSLRSSIPSIMDFGLSDNLVEMLMIHHICSLQIFKEPI